MFIRQGGPMPGVSGVELFVSFVLIVLIVLFVFALFSFAVSFGAVIRGVAR